MKQRIDLCYTSASIVAFSSHLSSADIDFPSTTQFFVLYLEFIAFNMCICALWLSTPCSFNACWRHRSEIHVCVKDEKWIKFGWEWHMCAHYYWCAVIVAFSKNGEWLGDVFRIPRSTQEAFLSTCRSQKRSSYCDFQRQQSQPLWALAGIPILRCPHSHRQGIQCVQCHYTFFLFVLWPL